MFPPLSGGLGEVYCIICTVTGAMYIGFSIYLVKRIRNYILNSTNIHLRRAIKMYGLEKNNVIIVEYVEVNEEVPVEEAKKTLLARELYWLDWLFSLPETLRYIFLPVACSALG